VFNKQGFKTSEVEGIDLGDDEKNKNNEEDLNNIVFDYKNGNKFIEVITGSEVIKDFLKLFYFFEINNL